MFDYQYKSNNLLHPIVDVMYASIKYPYPPHGRSLEIPRVRRRGLLKAKIFKGKYGALTGISRGVGGFKTKNLPWKGYGYLMEQHNDILKS